MDLHHKTYKNNHNNQKAKKFYNKKLTIKVILKRKKKNKINYKKCLKINKCKQILRPSNNSNNSEKTLLNLTNKKSNKELKSKEK